MTMTRRLLSGLILACTLLLTPFAADAQGPLIDAIKKRGKMQVAFGSFVPWAMRDKQGNWVGFEIDVATKLSKDMGVGLDLIPTAFDAIIPSLIANKFDVIIGGLTVTPVRQEQIDFTVPYSNSGQTVAASKQLAAKFKYPDDYNNANVTFACRRGTASCKIVEEKFPKATVRPFDDDAIAFQEVINGNAHAIVSSEPKPTFFTLKNADKLFKPASENIAHSVEGFGVRKASPTTIAYFNDWIGKNKDWLQQRHTFWFKTQDWAALVP